MGTMHKTRVSLKRVFRANKPDANPKIYYGFGTRGSFRDFGCHLCLDHPLLNTLPMK